MYFFAEYYWIGIILQIITIIHAIKTGRNNWIYILIFLPFIGSVIYFVMEILPGLKGSNSFFDVTLFSRGENISHLEKQLRISDTFSNRTRLASAYASRKKYDQAIEMYQSALTGMYSEDLETTQQMARVYFLSENYTLCVFHFEKALEISKQKFIRPDDEFWYALALYKSGNFEKAELAFKKHIQFHKTFDSMYYYGELLISQGRQQEARQLFETILDQRDLIPRHLRRFHSKYVSMAKKALSKMN